MERLPQHSYFLNFMYLVFIKRTVYTLLNYVLSFAIVFDHL